MKNRIFLLLSLGLIFSCSTRSADPDGKVGSDIKIILQEEVSKDGSRLGIRSETFEIFGCYNFMLLTEQHLENEKITISYSGIHKPDICLTAMGPAHSVATFSLKNGSYDIVFINDGVRNEGSLIVDEERYFLELKDPKNVYVEEGELKKH